MEIRLEDLDPEQFIREKVKDISSTIGDNIAINTLSGGVDSSVVTMLGHRALGTRFRTYFIDNGLMRDGEPEYIVSLFRNLDVPVELVDSQDIFLNRLQGLTDPEEKREAITQAFYKDVFGPIVKEIGARCLFQGTNYTDAEETAAGIKRQHNVFEQIGIDPEEAFGYKIIEPLIQLRKSAIREVAKALNLPAEIYNRPPFPGPALATRIIGEVTPERVKTVRKATSIVEQELQHLRAFQYFAILHQDRVTGKKDEKRKFGQQIEIRCWESTDAVTATPTHLPYEILETISNRITTEIPEVVSITYNITPKPPSTIEAI